MNENKEKLLRGSVPLLGSLGSDPMVDMFTRHWTIFILPIVLLIAAIVILALGLSDCDDGKLKCLVSADKPYVTAFVGLVAAAIALWGWLAAYYREIDRQRFDLFNSLHKEFRTTTRFNNTFKAIAEMEKLVAEHLVKDQEDPFEFIDDHEAVDFAAFFEIVEISVQSNLTSAEIANYFFGNYLIMALNSKQFRSKIDYDEERYKPYWGLLRRFENQVMVERGKMKRPRYASSLRI